MVDFWTWTIDEDALKKHLVESYDDGEQLAPKAKKLKQLLITDYKGPIDDVIREAMEFYQHEALEEIGFG